MNKINLVSADYSDEELGNPEFFENITVAGWGKTGKGDGVTEETWNDDLMKLNLSLVKNDECEKILGYKTRKLPISSQICATGEQFKSDSCSGDSGGPLMAFNKKSGQTEVIGIVSIDR